MNERNSSIRAKVYECYMKGMTPEQAINELGALSVRKEYIGECYNSFAIIRQQDSEYRLLQIKHIEQRLFELIEENREKPKAINSHLINELSTTYSRFLVV